MRTAAQSYRTPGQRSPVEPPRAEASSFPAPTEGWDASSPLAKMNPKRAIILDNFFPQPEYIELERGWITHCQLEIDNALTGAVETLMAYNALDDNDDRFFACSGGTIFDVTDAASLGIASSVTSLSNDRLQHVNFQTTGTSVLYWVNGEDAPRAYDGSTWVTPAITGLDETTFVNLNVHKNRLWFIVKNSLDAAYLPVDSYQGAAVAFPLTGVFTRGGFLVAMGTWTLDAGEGMDDHAVFISSEGQVAVYRGTDPSDSSDWSLVGVYNIGPPIGYRCLTRVGGDIAIISIDGVLPLSQALLTDRAAAQRIALTRRISRAMNEAARNYKNNFGWQLIGYPRGTRAILNVPVQENDSQIQFQMNTLHGAWCRRLRRPANCWEVFHDRLFFGGNAGDVCEADVGGTDGFDPIIAQSKSAFNYFGSPGVLKRYTMIRPNLNTSGSLTPSILLNTDFTDETPDIIAGEPALATALWDEVNWDEFYWPEEQFLINEWQPVSAVGQCASVNMIVSGLPQIRAFWDEALWDDADWDAGGDITSEQVLKVNAFDVTFERGGFF